MKCFWTVAAVMAAATVLAGCATQAQVQAKAIGSVMRPANVELEACATSAYNDPAYAIIQPRQGLKDQDITLQQMASTDKVTDAEIAALYARHDKIRLCREHYIDAVSTVEPGTASILVQSFTKIDKALVDLIQRKTTWGEYVTAARGIAAQTRMEANAEVQRLRTALEQSHEAELARRQQALAALGQYVQTQQFINTMNTPAPVTVAAPRTCRTVLLGTIAQTQCY